MADRRNTNRRWKTISDLEKDCYDNYAPAFTMISEPHRMIHDGKFFNASGKATALADAASLDLLIRLPVGEIRHVILVEFAADDAPLDILFYEGTTTSDDGTAVNIRNHNRVGTPDDGASLMTVGPTVTDLGTLLHSRYIPAPSAPGGQPAGQLVTGEDGEWVLGHPALERTYLWRVTNNSGGAINIGYHFNGYQTDG